MSDCKAVECDRCGKKEASVNADFGVRSPEGWCVVRVDRNKPFLASKKDFCPTCAESVLVAFYGLHPLTPADRR